MSMMTATGIEAVAAAAVHTRLGYATPLQLPPATLTKPLVRWRMQEDDQPIFRWLYRHHQPRRHLEFGTWRGEGACYLLEETRATVWTINLFEGEAKPDGGYAYGESLADPPPGVRGRTLRDGRVEHQTDAFGCIGSEFRRRGLGHRVCQVHCNSLEWDTRNLPLGFFDSVLVDGGHDPAVVESDTRKALPLLRAGGLMLWHDFCLDDDVRTRCSSVRGVSDGVAAMHDTLRAGFADLFWIEPSWILVGVRA